MDFTHRGLVPLASALDYGFQFQHLHGQVQMAGFLAASMTSTNQPRINFMRIFGSHRSNPNSWRRAAFEMQSPVAAAFQSTPLSNASIPSATGVTYAAIYMVVLGSALRHSGLRFVSLTSAAAQAIA